MAHWLHNITLWHIIFGAGQFKSIPWEDRFGEAFDGLMTVNGSVRGEGLVLEQPKAEYYRRIEVLSHGCRRSLPRVPHSTGIQLQKGVLCRFFSQGLSRRLKLVTSKCSEANAWNYLRESLFSLSSMMPRISHFRASMIRTAIITMTPLTCLRICLTTTLPHLKMKPVDGVMRNLKRKFGLKG